MRNILLLIMVCTCLIGICVSARAQSPSVSSTSSESASGSVVQNFEQMTDAQREEWLLRWRIMNRTSIIGRNPPECNEALSNSDSKANDIEWATRSLNACIANSGFSDDCYSKFRNVKNSYEEWQSQLQEVETYCPNK